jgi:hypothetical protein
MEAMDRIMNIIFRRIPILAVALLFAGILAPPSNVAAEGKVNITADPPLSSMVPDRKPVHLSFRFTDEKGKGIQRAKVRYSLQNPPGNPPFFH